MTRNDASNGMGFMTTSTFCSSLYGLLDCLRKINKGSLNEIIKYSYILSLQNFIETSETTDFGSCEEQ